MATESLSRSKRLLESEGWKVAIVERWNPWAHIRQDLFSMADLIAIKDGHRGVTGIQCCGEDCSSHIKKLIEGYVDIHKGKLYGPNNCLPIWLKAGNTFFIWSWTKRCSDGRGSRKTWQLREGEFLLESGQVVTRENSRAEDAL